MLRGLVGLAKASIGKSGRLKASEKAAITKAAKLNNMSPTEFRKAAKVELKTPTAAPATTKKKTYPSLESLGKGKAKPTPTAKDQGSTKGLTRRQKAQRKNLIERSKADERKAKLQREGVVLKGEEPDRIKLTAGGTEVLPSKEQIDPKIRNYSKRRIRELIKTGQAKMVVDKKGKRSIKTTGKFASPQSMVAEEMGLGSRGALPTAEEARALGLTVKKGGGMVKAKGGKFIKGLISKVKKAVSPKKKPVVAKKPVKKPTGIRRKLQGKSATDIHKAYTIPQINQMKKNLGQAGTPDSKLINRLNKALAVRKKVTKKPKTKEFDWKKAGYTENEWRDVLGLTRKDPETGMNIHHKGGGPVIKRKKPGPVKIRKFKEKLPRKKEQPWGKRTGYRRGTAFGKKSGGAIKRNKGGAVRGVGKATRGFGNAKYSKKMY